MSAAPVPRKIFTVAQRAELRPWGLFRPSWRRCRSSCVTTRRRFIEVNGEEYVAIASGGNQSQLSANGYAVCVFSLKGQLGPLWPPPVPQSVAGPVADGVNTIKIGDKQRRIFLWASPTPG